MPLIKLQELGEDGTILDTFSGEISESDLKLFNKYSDHLNRLTASTLVRRGVPGIDGIKWEQGQLFISGGSYTNPELYELLHLLRPLILHKESASFASIRSALNRCFQNKRLSLHMKSLQHAFDHGQLASYMQVTIGEQKIFNDSLLRMWLNGTQYHTEEAKAAAWLAFEDDLKTENTRVIVMNQLKDKIYALLELGHIVKQILRNDVDLA